MKRGDRSSLIKNIIGVVCLVAAIVLGIFSKGDINEILVAAMYFGIIGVFILLMPVEPFKNLINLFKFR